jgi:hypothetical protein
VMVSTHILHRRVLTWIEALSVSFALLHPAMAARRLPARISLIIITPPVTVYC